MFVPNAQKELEGDDMKQLINRFIVSWICMIAMLIPLWRFIVIVVEPFYIGIGVVCTLLTVVVGVLGSIFFYKNRNIIFIKKGEKDV